VVGSKIIAMISYVKRVVNYYLDKYKFIRGEMHLNSRKGAIHKSWGHVFSNHLFGDYVEFGVYQGDSFHYAIKSFLEFKGWLNSQKTSDELWRINTAKKSILNQEIYFHGLDTFEGMPKNNEKNIIFKEKNFISDIKEVEKKLHKLKNIKYYLYKGLFKDSEKKLISNLNQRPVSIVNFDCDLETSTSDALKIISNHIQIGTVFLFDDYNGFNADNRYGQRKAFKDYRQDSNFIFEKFFTYGYSGQTFLLVENKNY